MLISSETLRNLYEDGPGATFNGYYYMADQEEGSGRWDSHHLMILEELASGDFFACEYSKGLTENQDSDFPWKPLYEEMPDTVDCYQVYPEEVRVTKYVRWPDAAR